MADQYDRQPPQPSQPSPHLSLRHWWDQATEQDQDAVLANLREPRGWAGVPWAFLPDEIRNIMSRRLRIKPKAEE